MRLHSWTPLDEFKKNLDFYFSARLNRPYARPHWIFFSLSHRCTYRCRMCGVVNILEGKELDAAAVTSCLDEIASWQNNPVVLFTGGEPFLRKDLFELVSHSVNCGLTTEVVSNGSLIDESAARMTVSSGLSNIAISLDGAVAQTHDRLRQKGAFARALEALKLLADAKHRLGCGPQISAWVTIMKENINELSDIIPIVRDTGVECLVYHPVIVAQDNMQNTSPEAAFWPGKEEISELRRQIGVLKEYQAKNGLIAFLHDPDLWIRYFENSLESGDWKCNPYVFINVGPDGEVRSCGESFGNISGGSIGRCLETAEAYRARSRMLGCSKPCLQTCWARPEAESLKGITQFFISSLQNNAKKQVMIQEALKALAVYENQLIGGCPAKGDLI